MPVSFVCPKCHTNDNMELVYTTKNGHRIPDHWECHHEGCDWKGKERTMVKDGLVVTPRPKSTRTIGRKPKEEEVEPARVPLPSMESFVIREADEDEAVCPDCREELSKLNEDGGVYFCPQCGSKIADNAEEAEEFLARGG